MTVKLYAFTCGTLTGEFAHLMEGGEGDVTVPIPVFLIEHPSGRALFDTGLHPDCQHDPAGRLGPRLAGLFRIDFKPGEEVSARLEAIDRDPARIDLVINSHFHFDHVGGNALIPNATMLVQRREWDAGMDPGHHGEARVQSARFRPRTQIVSATPFLPEIWPRLEEGALICKSRDDLVRYQTQIANGSSATTPGQAPDCHTIRKQTGIQILAHDGPSRTQIVTTDESKETWWTNSYLPSTPPPSVAKGPGAGK